MNAFKFIASIIFIGCNAGFVGYCIADSIAFLRALRNFDKTGGGFYQLRRFPSQPKAASTANK